MQTRSHCKNYREEIGGGGGGGGDIIATRKC